MKADSQLEKVSIEITKWIGTTQSIIVHTILFIVIFGLYLVGFALDQILLILTTAVSLEAIYLALFIQMTVNRNTQDIVEVASDIDQIQEDVEELGGDFDDIQEDVEEISDDIDRMQERKPHLKTTSEITHVNIQYDLKLITAHLRKLEEEISTLQNSLSRSK